MRWYRWLRWFPGRQHTGYDTMLLMESQWLKFDLWILRFKQGDYINRHVDETTGGRHYRLNIYLKNADVGGEFECVHPIIRNRFMTLFRPDITPHSVTKVEKGTRYVLSFGFVLKDKKCKN